MVLQLAQVTVFINYFVEMKIPTILNNYLETKQITEDFKRNSQIY
jgi:hypothetical protein